MYCTVGHVYLIQLDDFVLTMKYIILAFLLCRVYECVNTRRDFPRKHPRNFGESQHSKKGDARLPAFSKKSTKDVAKATKEMNDIDEKKQRKASRHQTKTLRGFPKQIVMVNSNKVFGNRVTDPLPVQPAARPVNVNVNVPKMASIVGTLANSPPPPQIIMARPPSFSPPPAPSVLMVQGPQIVPRPVPPPMVIPISRPHHDDELKTLKTLNDILTTAALLGLRNKERAQPVIALPPAPPMALPPLVPIVPLPYAPPIAIPPGSPPGSTMGSPPESTMGSPPESTIGSPPGSTEGSPPGSPQGSKPIMGSPQGSKPIMGSPTNANTPRQSSSPCPCRCKEECRDSCDGCLYGIIKDFFESPCCGCCAPKPCTCTRVVSAAPQPVRPSNPVAPSQTAAPISPPAQSQTMSAPISPPAPMSTPIPAPMSSPPLSAPSLKEANMPPVIPLPSPGSALPPMAAPVLSAPGAPLMAAPPMAAPVVPAPGTSLMAAPPMAAPVVPAPGTPLMAAPPIPQASGASFQPPRPIMPPAAAPFPGAGIVSPPVQPVSSGPVPQGPVAQTPSVPILPKEGGEQGGPVPPPSEIVLPPSFSAKDRRPSKSERFHLVDHNSPSIAHDRKKTHPLHQLRKEFRAAFSQAMKSGQRKAEIKGRTAGKKVLNVRPCPQSSTHMEWRRLCTRRTPQGGPCYDVTRKCNLKHTLALSKTKASKFKRDCA